MKFLIAVKNYLDITVAPHGGAWIEIELYDLTDEKGNKSLPTGERGLKFDNHSRRKHSNDVAPHGGAWIEINGSEKNVKAFAKVAPHGGAWIEIIASSYSFSAFASRSPRGSVD